MKRVLVVVGTRPEAIKLAPVVAGLRAHEDLETALALTGQHTDMVAQVLDAFDLEPSYDLAIMKPGQSLYDVAHGCLDGMRGVIRDFQPDMTVVQGDTATVFFTSLVAFFERTAVGHVEAGLRSHDKWAPFPEEVLRRLTGVVTDLHFTPTERSRHNLLREGVPEQAIHVTGNTVVDALLQVAERTPGIESPDFASAVASPGPLLLLTAHRRESFGEPLREVFRAVREIADARPDLTVLYPVHPNPNVQQPAREILGGHPRITLTDPVGYLDLVQALKRAQLVLTDSGGIQEEAPTFGAPVLVLRDVTERPEGVDAGVARLVGTDRALIVGSALELLDGSSTSGDERPPNPYGDGRAGLRIADIIRSRLTGAARETHDWAST